ncbi:hypothetical protein IDJ77_13255 [Mucilaginibacter sp. ZT4R22]|uniref:Uncharacterized protein n=1 Tax=Mucilaginibacter pankratovii TaxID=2772110 RepID=A0ABR7WR57_9SPHI|nr:hypothetical protein [Mucilaginibacter pankratovii]MBD1364782.1 hypothetical protein [Mucilaginibacter pankratovii]
MVHLIITTANITEAFGVRKQQYVESIEAALKYAAFFDTYTILECFSEKEAYLDKYNTFYSREGNPYRDKGLNEMNHLRAFLEQSPLADDDSIIKLSGKYVIEEPYFFETLHQLHHEYDSMFKNDNDVYVGNGYHTFFYYMKKKLFLDAIGNIDFSVENNRPIEWDMKSFLMVKDRHIEIDRLGLLARQGTNSEKIFRC